MVALSSVPKPDDHKGRTYGGNIVGQPWDDPRGRPVVACGCRNWTCNWILEPALGPRVAAADQQMILYYENEGRRLCVRVDPGYANAWRREPYYSQLKECARRIAEAHKQVVVYIRKKAIVILPDNDVDIGDLDVGDQIWVGAQNTPAGKKWHAADVPPDEATAWVMSRAAK
jgi:hypothetical protein